MFDLDKSLQSWLKAFRKHKAFGHGTIREMELHLRDHIDDLVSSGLNEQDAFEIAVREFGEIKPMARETYWSQRPTTNNNLLINTTMLKNYFKIAVRNFMKHKFYTFVNVFGLTSGLAIVFLIALFVNDELTFDQFHKNKDELYRVVENQYYDGQPVFPVAVTPNALGPSLLTEYPEIVHFTRVSMNNYIFELGDRKISERNGAMVDEHFFEMFSFPISKGTIDSFKDNLNALVLNEDLAKKYFQDENPIGRSLKLDGEEYTVMAVVENVPKNSHLYFTYLVNFEKYLTENPGRANNWGSNGLYTYVQLSPQADFDEVNNKVTKQIKKNLEASVTDIYLQPLTDIYLGEVDFVVEVPRKGEKLYVRIFSIVAVFILVISCINFMNLSTARSAKRAKEVGLRKTIGARKNQLIFQFLSESVILSILAVILSVGLVAILLPSFNQLTGKEFDFVQLFTAKSGIKLGLSVLIVAIFTGLLSGSYPAVFLSSVRPVLTLNSQTVTLKQGALLRKGLVIFQFVISVVLIIGTMVVYSQLNFMQNIDIGYNKENIIYSSARSSQAKLFANELRDEPGIVNVGLSNRHPAYVMSSSSGFTWPGQNPDETILLHFMGIDEHYMETMEMELMEGRHFLEADSAVVMINEKAKEVMGLDDPVGKTITYGGDLRIVGVAKDFNFKSVHSEIEPIVIFKLNQMSQVYIKYEPSQEASIVETVENVWNKVFPDSQFNYDFLSQDLKELYSAEQRTSKISTYFAVLAIIISCLGLFGLMSYALEQRTKEIGIRKALGASVKTLFVLLTNDFTKLVIISLFISIPLGWYGMNKWLSGFAYRTDLSIWMFLLAGISALVITLFTVSYQTIRASRNSPVQALRNE